MSHFPTWWNRPDFEFGDFPAMSWWHRRVSLLTAYTPLISYLRWSFPPSNLAELENDGHHLGRKLGVIGRKPNANKFPTLEGLYSTAWWLSPTPLKNMSERQLGWLIIPNWMESHKIHVPNRPPVYRTHFCSMALVLNGFNYHIIPRLHNHHESP